MLYCAQHDNIVTYVGPSLDNAKDALREYLVEWEASYAFSYISVWECGNKTSELKFNFCANSWYNRETGECV